MEDFKVNFIYKSGSGSSFQFQAIDSEEADRTSKALTKFLIQLQCSQLSHIEVVKIIKIEEIFNP